jgi:hypothetical protein
MKCELSTYDPLCYRLLSVVIGFNRASLTRGPALEEVLVTTADSRLRLYHTDTFGMSAKYKGHAHEALHIGAR